MSMAHMILDYLDLVTHLHYIITELQNGLSPIQFQAIFSYCRVLIYHTQYFCAVFVPTAVQISDFIHEPSCMYMVA